MSFFVSTTKKKPVEDADTRRQKETEAILQLLFLEEKEAARKEEEDRIAEEQQRLRNTKPSLQLVTPELSEEQFREYAELSKEIGYSNPQMLKQQVELVLQRSNVQVYDLDHVYEYMLGMAQKQGDWYTWNWYALRQSDLSKVELNHHSKTFSRPTNNRRSEIIFYGRFANGVYGKTVPIHILRMVKELEKDLDMERIGFYVTDYTAVNPDPFICLTAHGLPIYVFGVWDEPGFFAK